MYANCCIVQPASSFSLIRQTVLMTARLLHKTNSIQLDALFSSEMSYCDITKANLTACQNLMLTDTSIRRIDGYHAVIDSMVKLASH